LSENNRGRISLMWGLALLISSFLGASAQPEEEWNTTFGGPGFDWGSSVQEKEGGGYVIAGHTESYGAGRNDAWLIATDASGNEEWNKTFGGIGNDFSRSVLATKDGGYILVGSTGPWEIGGSDVWLIKTNSEGNELWNKTLGGSDNDFGASILEIENNGYIVVGNTESYGSGDSDIWLIKMDSKGEIEWDKTFGGLGDDGCGSVVATEDGGYVVGGVTQSYGNGSNDLWLIKTDSEGNKEWDRTFGGSGDDYGGSVLQTEDGGYLLMGHTRVDSAGIGGGVVWLIKTDSEGNLEWEKTFDYEDGDYFGSSIRKIGDGGYLIAGAAASYREGPTEGDDGVGFGSDGHDILIIKTDPEGNELWNITFGKSGLDDQGGLAKETKDGGYIVLCNTESYGAGHKDFWLIKLDKSPPE
jgi:hypothetical protein